MNKKLRFKRNLILSLGLTSVLLTPCVSIDCSDTKNNSYGQVKEVFTDSVYIVGSTSKMQFEEITKTTEETIKEVEYKPDKVCLGTFYVTSYCSCPQCCGQYAYNRPCDEYGNEIVYGASGEVLQSGYSIAVDTNIIPFGTKVEFDGKEYVAQDVGGAIKGNRIDVYSSSHSEALNFPTGYYEVYMEE